MARPNENWRDYWKRHFRDAVPLGYHLRAAFPDHWVRFHALPESRRSAASQEDWDTIVERANTLAGALFQEGSTIWLCTVTWESDSEEFDPVPHQWRNPILCKHGLVRENKQIEDDSDSDYASAVGIYAGKVVWTSGRFDEAFRQIADDFDTAIWCDPEKSVAFAPYDGGFDVFLETSEQVEEMRSRFIAWYPEGGL